MRVLLACALSAVAAMADSKFEQVEGYTFEQYVVDFNKKYSDGEWDARKAAFEANLNTIIEHNKAGHSWKLGVNHLAAHFPEEMAALKGLDKQSMYRGHARAQAGGLFQSEVPLKPLEELPSEVDWRTRGVLTPVKNQGGCGSCWAFATTEAVESHLAINTGQLVELSPQNVVSCVKDPQHCGGTGGCQGATAELGLDYVMQNGIAAESADPYQAVNGTCPDGQIHKVAVTTGQVHSKLNDYNATMNAVANGPVAVSIDASTFALYSSGVFDGCNYEHPDIDHGVQLVGYGSDAGEDYWIIRNSWGPNWGEQGFIRIKRHADAATNPKKWCAQDVTSHHGIACDGDPDTVEVCGTCGMWFDVRYPTGAKLVDHAEVDKTEIA